MKRLDIATARACVVKNAIENAHGGLAVQTADISLGFIQPFNAVRQHYLLSGKSWGFMPNSASTSSMGMPFPLAKNAWLS